MCCQKFWKRILSFVLTLSLGLLIVAVLQEKKTEPNQQLNIKSFRQVVFSSNNDGGGTCPGFSDPKNLQAEPSEKPDSDLEGLNIISKPRANYTEEARANRVQGKVVLKVAFLANGEIGTILAVTELPDGLTEQAIAAARKIKFEPAKIDGKPATVRKTIEYAFTIY